MIIKDLEINQTLDREALTKFIGGGSFSLARKGRNPQTGKEIRIARKGRNPQTGKEIKIQFSSYLGSNLLNPSRTY
jgi:nucleoid DNA-binding protein